MSGKGGSHFGVDAATFAELLTPAGQAAIGAATALAPTDRQYLACYQRLQKQFPAVLAKAALDTVLLRQRARRKFPQWAGQMYFEREALEQASGSAVAGYRAERFRCYGRVADWCCGIGGDTLGLAAAGCAVTAVERDPLRAAMAMANVAVIGAARHHVQVVPADVLQRGRGDEAAVFVDPSRRDPHGRQLDPERYEPPLSALLRVLGTEFPWGVKLAPGVSAAALRPYQDVAEAEWIAVDGELKECVLWFGPLRQGSRRATVILTGGTGDASVVDSLVAAAGALQPPPRRETVAEYVFLPSPAVVRAGLTDQLAGEWGLARLDSVCSLLTGSRPACSPLFDAYQVQEVWPHDRRLRQRLRGMPVGTPVVVCGSPIDAEAVRRECRARPDTRSETRSDPLLLLAMVGRRPVVILARRLITSPFSG